MVDRKPRPTRVGYFVTLDNGRTVYAANFAAARRMPFVSIRSAATGLCVKARRER